MKVVLAASWALGVKVTVFPSADRAPAPATAPLGPVTTRDQPLAAGWLKSPSSSSSARHPVAPASGLRDSSVIAAGASRAERPRATAQRLPVVLRDDTGEVGLDVAVQRQRGRRA